MLLLLPLAASCENRVERVDFRSSCLVCHMPRARPGAEPFGIENAHPFGEIELACTDCHGGNPRAYHEEQAHVEAKDGVPFIRNLTSGQLDRIDPAYVQFINPGDFRVANTGCGAANPAAGGTGCHQVTVDAARNSMMAHTAGEVVVARYRAGAQSDPLAHVGATRLFDPAFDPDRPTTVERMEKFEPGEPRLSLLDVVSEPAAVNSTTALALYAEVQDDYMAKACFRCHLWDFGENRFRADFRSSGCSACHMIYSDEGISQSNDPNIPREEAPHPIKHELTSRIPTEQCTHCHYRGGRIGPSFQGYRESAGPGFNPDNPDTLGVTQHGHDAAYYLTDEDRDNAIDETPPDIHFERGMHCIDCHRVNDVHGDGHIYSDTQVAVAIECEDCHGTIDEETALTDSFGNRIEGLDRDTDGNVLLTSRVSGVQHPVTQIKRSIDPGDPNYSPAAAAAMGRDANGFSHTTPLECYTCHAAWYPSCYGCHVTMDYSRTSRVLTSGEARAGKPSGTRLWVGIDDLVLMWNTEEKIAPSMPSERFFMSVKDGEGNVKMDTRARRRPDPNHPNGARIAFGQRTFQPHTIRTSSQFSACDRCHIREDRANEARVRQTVGLGSDRYPLTDDTGRTYRLDALFDEDGRSLIEVGHNEPGVSRPLETELRRKLLEEPVR